MDAVIPKSKFQEALPSVASPYFVYGDVLFAPQLVSFKSEVKTPATTMTGKAIFPKISTLFSTNLAKAFKRKRTRRHERGDGFVKSAKRDINAPYPPELRADYKRLIDIKLREGLTPEQETELAAIRAEMNRIDRTTEAWRMQERAGAIIDRKLADLRREIEAELERGQ